MASRLGPRCVVIIDHVPQVLRSIQILTNRQVLVGIPDANTGRDDPPGMQVNNAQLGYIHETGDPSHNLPARPFLVPGVAKSIPQVLPALEIASEAAMAGNDKKVDQALHAAGLIASASAKREISTAPFVPLRPQTVASRHRSRKTQTMRPGEVRYLQIYDQLVAGGMHPDAAAAMAQSAVGIQPLINSGQLRNSITYVVRDRT